jgi:hypothetical protein
MFKPKSNLSLRGLTVTAALAFSFMLLCNFAQASEDKDYAKIGWWHIAYREVDDMTGCDAKAEFQDRTRVTIAQIQKDNGKSWAIFISNPKWDSWMAKRKQHFLFIVTINPNKVWSDPWSVTDDGSQLFMTANVDFVNSLADAKYLAIYDEKKRPLIELPLNMKDSEDAIKAVVNCVRDHPRSGVSSPDGQGASTASSSGTAFFIAQNLLLTNN